MIMDTLGCQPSQPVNQCRKISHCQDRAGFVPRVIQKCSGSPATSHHLCNCTGELCVHPVHLFTKLGTCPLTKSGGFPTPCPSDTPRVPGGFRGAGAVHHPWPPLVGGASLRPSRLAAHRSYNPMATSAAAPAGIYPLGELISNGGRGRYVKVRVTGVTGVTPSIKLLIILNIVALHALKPRDL